MTEQPQFKEAGAFLRQKRKAKGFKTQRAFIAALRNLDPDISCSESYVSLIEKGVKTPGVHLLDMMAEVLDLSATEKGELLLTYKRVPSDFEFAVRDNLKAAAQLSRLDRIRAQYTETPNRENFNHLLIALILEEQTQEAMDLLKLAPTFENELLELQERTAKMASLSGNYAFATQAFELALENCRTHAEHAHILLHLGILQFQQALKAQDRSTLEALEHYLLAFDYFEQSLSMEPAQIFALDEKTRCAYHIGDALLQLVRSKALSKPAAKTYPRLAKAFEQWTGKKVSAEALQTTSQAYFELARQGYQSVLEHADHSPLPDKPMQEAVFFHAYVHAKLKLFSQARVLIHSNLLLERNWLTYFMKVGLAVMEYEEQATPQLLDEAIKYLEKALEYDADTVLYLIRTERQRELKTLWEDKLQEMEALVARHEN